MHYCRTVSADNNTVVTLRREAHGPRVCLAWASKCIATLNYRFRSQAVAETLQNMRAKRAGNAVYG